MGLQVPERWVIITVTLLITPLISTHEPSSMGGGGGPMRAPRTEGLCLVLGLIWTSGAAELIGSRV